MTILGPNGEKMTMKTANRILDSPVDLQVRPIESALLFLVMDLQKRIKALETGEKANG